ncbi:MAG: glycosyltransferase [Coriobacteriia bacterium]|nr:glycosyltransferase [Coriobacteriia bacterium]
MKTVFLQTHVVRPRNIRQLRGIGEISDIALVYVERTQSFGTVIPEDLRLKVHKITADIPESGNMLKRLRVSLGLKKYYLNALAEEDPDCIQVEGFDCLYFAWSYARKNKVALVYQVSDVREILLPQKTFFGRCRKAVFSSLEALFLKRVDALVVTSDRFYEDRYKKYIPEDKVVLWHNFPDMSTFDGFRLIPHEGFRVGFVGSVRYQKQLRMLVDATESMADTVAVFSGSGKRFEYDSLVEYSKDKTWVELTGPYDYDSEIAGIYSKLDCIYAVYDASNENVKIALPNKLYEAIICELPIVVAQGTFLADLVSTWGVGLSVPYDSAEKLKDALVSLRDDAGLVAKIKNNCRIKREEILSEKPQEDYRRIIDAVVR